MEGGLEGEEGVSSILSKSLAGFSKVAYTSFNVSAAGDHKGSVASPFQPGHSSLHIVSSSLTVLPPVYAYLLISPSSLFPIFD